MDISFVENNRKLSDEVLIGQIKIGNAESFRILLNRYLPMIRFYAGQFSSVHNEPEDLVQVGLMALNSAVDQYRPGQAAFSTFATLCVKRAMISESRSGARKRVIPSDLVSSIEDLPDIKGSDSPETLLIERENYRRLADSIRLELSKLEYRVLSEFLSGKSYRAIAVSCGISVKSVDNALKRIRGKLKKE